MSTCTLASSTPLWLTVGIITCYFIMIIVTSYFSVKSLKSTTEKSGYCKWDEASNAGKIVLWVKDIWGRKSVYLPLVAHLVDTATDVAGAAEFYQIASNSTTDECGINVWYLFGLSIGAMIVYRLVSAFAIWRITQSVTRIIFQMFDVELFRILWLSHLLGLNRKSSPQRLISVLEAVFEAAPQTMVQIIYLLKTNNFSGVIFMSSILSCFNLTNTIIGDDKAFLNVQFALPCTFKSGTKKHRQQVDAGNKQKEKIWIWITMEAAGYYQFGKWIVAHLFRIFDVPSSILLYVFVWYYVNGLVLLIIFS
eukprot:311635_1